MRNPNGFGSVIKMSGNRRKPFAVRITLGFDEITGKQQYKYLGYYKTRSEALKKLAGYNSNRGKYLNNQLDFTFEEIYNKWKVSHYKNLSENTTKMYDASFRNCKILHKKKMKELKLVDLQKILDNTTYGTKMALRTFFNLIYTYAMKNDLITKDYSKFVNIGKKETKLVRKPFSEEEIEKMWNLVEEVEWIDTVLILIYTGFRIGELLELRIENINLKEKTIIGGGKTSAGKDRLIPIHSKIHNLIKKRYNKENEYLIFNDNKSINSKYNKYRETIFKPLMKQLGMEHRIHDTRHTFATLLSKVDANKTSITKMIGHTNYGITEKIYTHKTIEDLRTEIEKI